MFARIQVSFPASAGGETRTMFVSSPLSESDKEFFFTDGLNSWTGRVDSELDGDFQQIKQDLVMGASAGMEFYIENDSVLVIKTGLAGSGGGKRRRANVLLEQLVAEGVRREKMSALLNFLVEEQRAREAEIASLAKQRKDLQNRVKEYSQQLLSRVLEKEASNADFLQRFVPILNAKKEQIRVLQQRIARMSSSSNNASPVAAAEMEEEESLQRPRQQSPSIVLSRAQEEEEDEPPKRARRRAKETAAAASIGDEERVPAAAPSVESKRAKTETEQELPPGWIRTTSRSRPGEVCYQHTDGRRQFAFPERPPPAPAAAADADVSPPKAKDNAKRLPPVPITTKANAGDDDSFLSEFF